VNLHYHNGVEMLLSSELPNGIRFEGSEGWIFVTRGDYSATASDPLSQQDRSRALSASDPRILTSEIKPDEIQLIKSLDHHGNWLQAIRTGQQPLCPVEVGHRSTSACLVSHIAMKLKRKLFWDPIRERFKNDDEANTLLTRSQRWPYIIQL
jgi:myo-inositol 2-dehydrogenase/D-chiro-inositol 1-dehydrogenase